MYIDTALYSFGGVLVPGYDLYQATATIRSTTTQSFGAYVSREEGVSENTEGLSLAFDGPDVTVSSGYGVSEAQRVDKVQDTMFNDVFTASGVSHRIDYRMNYGGIDVLETGRATTRSDRAQGLLGQATDTAAGCPLTGHGTVAVKARACRMTLIFR